MTFTNDSFCCSTDHCHLAVGAERVAEVHAEGHLTARPEVNVGGTLQAGGLQGSSRSTYLLRSTYLGRLVV